MEAHSKEFVAVSSSSTKITTNTLEGTHGLLKTKARRLNLFVGQPSKQKAFNDKISELVYRFNHRIYSEDFFLLFLNILKQDFVVSLDKLVLLFL